MAVGTGGRGGGNGPQYFANPQNENIEITDMLLYKNVSF